MEQEISSFRRDLEEVEASAKKLDADKTARDHQIRTLNDEIARQDELINKLNREKKRLQVRHERPVMQSTTIIGACSTCSETDRGALRNCRFL